MQAQITDLENNQGLNKGGKGRNSPAKKNEQNKSLESLGHRLDGINDQIDDIKEKCRQLDRASNTSRRSSTIVNELVVNSNNLLRSPTKKSTNSRIQSGSKSPSGRPASALSKTSKNPKTEKQDKK